MKTQEMENILNGMVEEFALVLGGIFTEHQVRDEAIWETMKLLDITHNKALSRLKKSKSDSRDDDDLYEVPKTHPAVETLLMNLKMKRSA